MEQLNALEHQLMSKFNNTKHHFIKLSAFNVLTEEVLETVKNENIDSIVMGTQGATGAKEIVLGTHTVHVIRRAPCPVIVVPAHFNYRAPATIVFPTDYEIQYQANHVKELIGIAKTNHGKTNVLHISAPDGITPIQLKNKTRLEQLLDVIDCTYLDMPDQEIIPAINSFISTIQADFLVMIQNEHNFLERLFIEPVIKKIAFYVDIPFMVIPFQD